MRAGADIEIIHPVGIEEIGAWTRRIALTFLGDPHSPRAEYRMGMLRENWSQQRSWAARTDGQMVATLATLPRTITVPGGADGSAPEIDIDAVTAVTVSPTHRRRGLLRAMMTEALREARERGDPLSGLISAEWPIYGRYGYAPATLAADWKLYRGRTGSEIPGDPTRLRQVEATELREVGPAVFDLERRQRAGQMNRDQTSWQWRLGTDEGKGGEPLPHNMLIHDGDQGAEGLVAWTATRDAALHLPRGVAEVALLIAATPQAYRDIWSYLSGLDGIDDVRVGNRPIDEPARWLVADGRMLVLTELVDFLWLRILDTAAALSARRYLADDEIVIEVIDTDGEGFAGGVFRIAAEGDTATCERVRGAPEIRITQRRLASIYLGGFGVAELTPAGGIEELTAGAARRLGAMFATPLAPWNATWF